MSKGRIARVSTLAVLIAAGCAAVPQGGLAQARTPAPSSLACDAIGAGGSDGTFDAPLTVLDSRRLYRYEGRQLRRTPEGVVLRVRADAALGTPGVHRLVACRLGADGTEISVRPSGAAFEVRLTHDEPAVARSIQASHAPD